MATHGGGGGGVGSRAIPTGCCQGDDSEYWGVE